jgi:hypothetical protein
MSDRNDAATEVWKGLAEMGLVSVHLLADSLAELLQALEADDEQLLDELVPHAGGTLRWVHDRMAETTADIELAAEPDWLARLLRGREH